MCIHYCFYWSTVSIITRKDKTVISFVSLNNQHSLGHPILTFDFQSLNETTHFDKKVKVIIMP